MEVALLFLVLFGHAAIWVAVVNRMHAVGWKRPTIRRITIGLFIAAAAIPLALGYWLIRGGADLFRSPLDLQWVHRVPLIVVIYLEVCLAGAVVTVLRWFRRHVLHRPPIVLRFHRTRRMTIRALPSTEPPHHFLAHLPGNQSLQLDLTERAINVPRLPSELDQLSIVHMSDFHFTGHIGKVYFQEVVSRSNDLEPDLVAITGDLVDQAKCIDWLPETLGRLRARWGVYFVLGNHDLRVDSSAIIKTLTECGLVHLGGRRIETRIRDQRVVLAGNEGPWIKPTADLRSFPPRDGSQLRIALAHSPDQFAWARQCDIDLLLAGHTHGGQIRLPLLGPIFAPSWAGVMYASGLFYAPPTILHVTRGISGQLPLRLNCAPEMAHLQLHAAPDAAV